MRNATDYVSLFNTVSLNGKFHLVPLGLFPHSDSLIIIVKG